MFTRAPPQTKDVQAMSRYQLLMAAIFSDTSSLSITTIISQRRAVVGVGVLTMGAMRFGMRSLLVSGGVY